MPNIKFNYLYRDSGNYKKFNAAIFSNPIGIDLSKLESLIKSKLIYETWFYAEEWKLPEIFTDIVDFRIDPTWHEFESIEYTDEPSVDSVNLIAFIDLIKKSNG
ncbi:MAG TPA: hypothetical protein DCO83_15170 [Mucilaginibacter sp.]|nr:hypothetical protein [Mucilaginibacter sp.]